MGNGKDGNKDQPGNYLVIPYYPGDPGNRPPPPAYPFWMCSSILVNGTPYAGQQLMVGQTVELDLNVINYGILPAPTLCLFFYAKPTTNFTVATSKIIGSTPVALSRNHLTTTPSPVSWKVPEGTPEHVCLPAMVTTPADPPPPGGNIDAAGDRHYGQQNVYVANAPPGGQISVPFDMANGAATTGRFRLEVTHVLVRHHALRHLIAGHSVFRKAEKIDLRPTSSKAQAGHHNINVELAAGEVVEVELNAFVPQEQRRGPLSYCGFSPS